jgi:hypothetical protein
MVTVLLCLPPRVSTTVGSSTVLLFLPGWPLANAGVTAPRAVRKMVTNSPGFAGGSRGPGCCRWRDHCIKRIYRRPGARLAHFADAIVLISGDV